MTPISTLSHLLPATGPATISYPAGDAVVIVVNGDLVSDGFSDLDRRVIEALGDGYRRLVLDVHQVSTIEPAALGLLWGALRGIRRRGGTLTAAGARPAVRPALEVLSSGGLTLHPTVRAALSETHDADPSS